MALRLRAIGPSESRQIAPNCCKGDGADGWHFSRGTLTAADDVVDRVVGLELGADDYVSKPFDLRELRAHVDSILRRCAWVPPRPPVNFGLSRRKVRSRAAMDRDRGPRLNERGRWPLMWGLTAVEPRSPMIASVNAVGPCATSASWLRQPSLR
jgi:hypothetical protein